MNRAQSLLNKMRNLLEFRTNDKEIPNLHIRNEKLEMVASLTGSWLKKVVGIFGFQSPEATKIKAQVAPLFQLFRNGTLNTVVAGKNCNLDINTIAELGNTPFIYFTFKINVGKGLSMIGQQRRSSKWFAQPLSASGEERVLESANYFADLFQKELQTGYSGMGRVESEVRYSGEGHYCVLAYSIYLSNI